MAFDRKAYMKEYNARPEQVARRAANSKKPIQRAGRNKRICKDYSKPHVRAKYMLVNVRCRAKKRGIKFDLTQKWVQTRLETGICELSGIPFTLANAVVGGKRIPNAFSPSVDKIDPEQGYTKDNSRVILFCLNSFKGRMSDEAMLNVMKSTLEHCNLT